MKKRLVLSFLVLFAFNVSAQEFMPGFDMFSHKKPAYITLNDGSKVEGELDKLNRKRNNISGIRMIIDGQEIEYAPEDVKEMYLPAHSLNKFSLKIDNATNTSKDYDLDMINEGYGFFENTEVILGKNNETLMMQLVNPSFASKVRVYFDPMAMETASMSVGPMKTGGVDRSYFIKVGDEPAYKVSKGNYPKIYKDLYASCPSLIKEIGKKPNWKEIAEHMYAYDACE